MKLKKFVKQQIHFGGMLVRFEIDKKNEIKIMLYFYLGLKYEKENEEDLKDQINFPHIPKKYPPNCK